MQCRLCTFGPARVAVALDESVHRALGRQGTGVWSAASDRAALEARLSLKHGCRASLPFQMTIILAIPAAQARPIPTSRALSFASPRPKPQEPGRVAGARIKSHQKPGCSPITGSGSTLPAPL
eukprot:scaffold205626_cov25-Tisochrysis_lutea.AAC.2